MQFLGLGICSWNVEISRMFGSQFGRVLHCDGNDKIWGTVVGPRIKVLVKATTVIPKRIGIPGEGSGVNGVRISRHPFQCATCRTFGHNSRACPQNHCRGRGQHSPHEHAVNMQRPKISPHREHLGCKTLRSWLPQQLIPHLRLPQR